MFSWSDRLIKDAQETALARQRARSDGNSVSPPDSIRSKAEPAEHTVARQNCDVVAHNVASTAGGGSIGKKMVRPLGELDFLQLLEAAEQRDSHRAESGTETPTSSQGSAATVELSDASDSTAKATAKSSVRSKKRPSKAIATHAKKIHGNVSATKATTAKSVSPPGSGRRSSREVAEVVVVM